MHQKKSLVFKLAIFLLTIAPAFTSARGRCGLGWWGEPELPANTAAIILKELSDLLIV